MNVIGIDLGGTKIAAAIFSDDGDVLYKNILTLNTKKGNEVGTLIRQQIKDLISVSITERLGLEAIGISIPGIYYSKKGMVWAPNIPGWDNYPLLQEVQSMPETKNLRIAIDSDRACYILGETWKGVAKGCQDAIFIAVGTGIGAGILIDGKILRGNSDIAGATGWMALDLPFREEFKECGCFEYHASGDGLARVTRDFLNKEQDYTGILRQKPIEQISSYDVFEAYQSNDLIATLVLDKAIDFWGMAVANFVSLFNPEKIILGGGVFGPAAQFLDRIIQEAHKWAQPISITQVKIVVSTLGGDAGVYGAGRLAILQQM